LIRQRFRILLYIIILVCIINLAGVTFGPDSPQGACDGFLFSLCKTSRTVLYFVENEARKSIRDFFACIVIITVFAAFAKAFRESRTDFGRLFFADLRREIREALTHHYHGSKYKKDLFI